MDIIIISDVNEILTQDKVCGQITVDNYVTTIMKQINWKQYVSFHCLMPSIKLNVSRSSALNGHEVWKCMTDMNINKYMWTLYSWFMYAL
jgi:hypothetical protein